MSDSVGLSCGAPQGGVLAPFAFTIYINDLLTELNTGNVSSLGYADDSCFLLKFSEGVDMNVNEELMTRVQTWSHRNGLLLNASKCCYMVFGNRFDGLGSSARLNSDVNHDASCSCPSISRGSEYRYLGVMLDDKLIWRSHVDLLCRKLRPAVACLAKLGRAASRRVVLQVYFALFESHLRYSILASGSAFRSILGPSVGRNDSDQYHYHYNDNFFHHYGISISLSS